MEARFRQRRVRRAVAASNGSTQAAGVFADHGSIWPRRSSWTVSAAGRREDGTIMMSLARDNRGQELVRHALTFTILLLIFLGIMEFAMELAVVMFDHDSLADATCGGRLGLPCA